MLSLVDVSAGYGSFRALFGVSLEISAGETVGVIGPNGAGKTTLMRVISGLVERLPAASASMGDQSSVFLRTASSRAELLTFPRTGVCFPSSAWRTT